MKNLKDKLIEIGCTTMHPEDFIAELEKNIISEGFEKSILTMLNGLVTASTNQEFKEKMEELERMLYEQKHDGEQSYEPDILMKQIRMIIIPDFSILHKRIVKFEKELDEKEKARKEEEKARKEQERVADLWRDKAKEYEISILQLVYGVCLSEVISTLPNELCSYFKMSQDGHTHTPFEVPDVIKQLDSQEQWNSIYTHQCLTLLNAAFGPEETDPIDENLIANKPKLLFLVLNSFCSSKGIELKKNMLVGLIKKKERNWDLHVRFTGQERNADELIQACQVFGDCSTYLNNAGQKLLLEELWDIGKRLGVYNKSQ